MLLQASQCKYLSPCFRLFWNVPKGNWWTIKNVFIFCKGSYCAFCTRLSAEDKNLVLLQPCPCLLLFWIKDVKQHFIVFFISFSKWLAILSIFLFTWHLYIFFGEFVCVCVCGDICMYMCIIEAWYQYGVSSSRPLAYLSGQVGWTGGLHACLASTVLDEPSFQPFGEILGKFFGALFCWICRTKSRDLCKLHDCLGHFQSVCF